MDVFVKSEWLLESEARHNKIPRVSSHHIAIPIIGTWPIAKEADRLGLSTCMNVLNIAINSLHEQLIVAILTYTFP